MGTARKPSTRATATTTRSPKPNTASSAKTKPRKKRPSGQTAAALNAPTTPRAKTPVTNAPKKPTPNTANDATSKASPTPKTRVAKGARRSGGNTSAGSKREPKARPNKPTTIDEYLSQADVNTRALLQELRATIHALVPEVSECISYSLPAFRYRGKVIAGFLATKTGSSYLPFSGTTLDTLSNELAAYSRTKSSLHFSAERPLPKSLVATLLRARIAEL